MTKLTPTTTQKIFFIFLSLFVTLIVVKVLEKVVEIGDRENTQKIKIDEALKKIKPAIKQTTGTLAKKGSSASTSPKQSILNPKKILKDSEITRNQYLLPSVLRRQLKGVKSGIIFDVSNKSIVWQKNADKPVGIASMTKMMTCLLVLEKVSQGKISLNSQYRITRSSTRTKPSWVALTPGDVVSVEELCKALMVKSANDAAKLLAEIVTGSEKVFVQLMNIRAAMIGMKGAKFYNPNGLTERDRSYNKSSALDMVKLSYLLLQYKDAVRWSSMKTANFSTRQRVAKNDILKMASHNKLLWRFKGVNGMKTGFTNAAGFCTTVTCEQDGRQVIIVLTGVSSKEERDRIALSTLKWFYSQVVNK